MSAGREGLKISTSNQTFHLTAACTSQADEWFKGKIHVIDQVEDRENSWNDYTTKYGLSVDDVVTTTTMILSIIILSIKIINRHTSSSC